MPRFVVFAITFSSFLLGSSLKARETPEERFLQHYLTLSYPEGALKRWPHFRLEKEDGASLWEAWIRLLSMGGREKEALQSWKLFREYFPGSERESILLRDLAWGVLKKGSQSRNFVIRYYAGLGLFFSRDGRAIPLLQAQLQDSNHILRNQAVELSAMMGDWPLRKSLLQLYEHEGNFSVQSTLLRSFGKFTPREVKGILWEVLEGEGVHTELQIAAAEALHFQKESISKKIFNELCSSPRWPLRFLACLHSLEEGQEKHLASLVPLLQDPKEEVRLAALQSLGLQWDRLDLELLTDSFTACLSDPSPKVQVTAAWALARTRLQLEAEELVKKVWDEDFPEQEFAAAALASLGVTHIGELRKGVKIHPKPLVRANLALGLLMQRENLNLACEELANLLLDSSLRLKWESGVNPWVQVLKEGEGEPHPFFPAFPEVQTQQVRLEILTLLGQCDYQGLFHLFESVLEKRSYGVPLLAGQKVLEVGGAEGFILLRKGLQHPKQEVRVQSAIVLAFYGKDPQALPVLKEEFPKAKRKIRLHILEAMGALQDPKVLPFLAECLSDPSESMRIVAALAIMQCS